MVAGGEIGALRVVQVEYAQEWLATRLEETGHKQADWRTDPARSGPAGSIGDIGSHAFNLAEFISGAEVASLAADLQIFVPGRRLDDNAHILLRFANGARGMLWSSQVAVGQENGLRIRLYGEKGGLEWHQEQPNTLLHSPLGEAPRLIRRGGHGAGPVAAAATRIPSGHPEGYLEAFAQLYTDVAELLVARMEGREPHEYAGLVPMVADGIRGVRFIEAAVRSSAANAEWTPV
jgi:predicted dehydrogenase